MAFMFGNGVDDAQPEDKSGATTLDWIKSLGASALDIGSQAASAIQAAGANTENPNLAQLGRGLAMGFDASSDALAGTITPGGKRAAEAALVPEDGQASLGETPFSSLMMKGTRALPALGVMAAFPESIIASAAAGGVTQIAGAADAALKKARGLSDTDLQLESPRYAELRETQDEMKARSQLDKEMFSGKDAFIQGLVGMATMGPAARVLKGAATSGSGMLKGAATGALETGAGMGVASGATDFASQNANVQAGSQPEVDWHHTLLAGFNGAADGVVMGGALGGFHGMGAKAKEPKKPKDNVEITDPVAPATDQDAALRGQLGGDTPAIDPTQIVREAQQRVAAAQEASTPPAPPVASAPDAPAMPTAPDTQVSDAKAAQQRVAASQEGTTPPAPPTPDAPLDSGNTVPEKPATLQEQQAQLVAGQRPAMMFPNGGGKKLPLPAGMKSVQVKGRGLFHYNPDMVDAAKIRELAAAGRENEVLGLGPVSKPEVMERVAQGETPVAVTERTPDGTEVKAAAGTDKTLPAQVDALEASKTPGNTIQAEEPQKVIDGRRVLEATTGVSPEEVERLTEAKLTKDTGLTKEERAELASRAEAKRAVAAPKDPDAPKVSHKSKAEQAAKAAAPQIAKEVFEAHPPVGAEHTNIERAEGRKLLEVRLGKMLAEARKRGLEVKSNVTAGTSDHEAFLTQAKKLYTRLKSDKASSTEIANLKADEVIGRATGDFSELRTRMKVEGEAQSKKAGYDESAPTTKTNEAALKAEASKQADERGGGVLLKGADAVEHEGDHMGRQHEHVDEVEAAPDEHELEDHTDRGVADDIEEGGRERPVANKAEGNWEAFGSGKEVPREGAFDKLRPKVEGKIKLTPKAKKAVDTAEEIRPIKRRLADNDAEIARELGIPEVPTEAPVRTFRDKVVQPIKTSTVSDAIDATVKYHGQHGGLNNAVTAIIRNRLKALVGDIKVHIVDRDTMRDLMESSPGVAGDRVEGFYLPGRNHIIVANDINPDRVHHVMLHEAIHAATARGLMADKASRKIFQDMMDEVLETKIFSDPHGAEDLLNEYGFQRPPKGNWNVDEFIAEALSNAHFQRMLADIPLSPAMSEALGLSKWSKNSVWRGIVEGVRRLLRFPAESHTALDGAMRAFDHFNEVQSRLRVRDHEGVAHPLTQEDPVAHFSKRPDVTQPGKDFINDPVRAAEEHIARPMDRAQDLIRDMADRPDMNFKTRKFFHKLMSNDHMRQGYEALFGAKDEANPMRRLTTAVEKIGSSARHYMEGGNALARRMYAMGRKYEGDKGWSQFQDLAMDATMADVHPDAPVDSPKNAHLALSKENQAKLVAGKDVEDRGAMDKWQSRAQHADLAKRYEALPPELKQLWGEATAHFRTTHNDMAKKLIHNIVDDAGVKGDEGLVDRIHKGEMTEEDKKLFSTETSKALEDATELKKIDGPYFPLMRRGDFVLTGQHKVETPTNARRADANTFEFKSRKEAHDFVRGQKLKAKVDTAYYDPSTGEKTTKAGGLSTAGSAEQRYQVNLQRQHTEFFDTIKEANARRAELADQLEELSPVQLRKDNKNFDYELSSPQVQTLVNSLRQKNKGAPDGRREEIVRQFLEASTKMRGGVRVEHRALPRRYVQGASSDLLHNTADYTSSTSAYRAKLDHAAEVDSSFKEMADKAHDTRYETDNVMKRQLVLHEMEDRVFGRYTPDYAEKMNPFMRHVMTVSFIKRMASPAHLLLHLTHPTMISVPVLGARHGVGNSYKALLNAYRDMGAGGGLIEGAKSMARMAKDFTAAPTNFVDYFAGKLSGAPDAANLHKMLNELAETGHIHPDAGLELHRMLPGQSIAARGLDRVDGAFRELTNATESVNRVAEAIAGYRLEMAKNGGNHDAAVRYTKDTLANSQGLYSATNAAPIFRNRALRPFLQFKQFPQMIYHLLAKNLYNAFKGESREVRVEAAKQFAYVVGTHAAMAGALGLPLEIPKVALMLANALGVTNTNWGDVEHAAMGVAAHHLGGTGSEILMHGLLRALGPLAPDVHHRLGLNSLFTFGEPEGSPQSTVNYILNMVGGAPVSLGLDALRGKDAIMAGEYMKGMEYLSPVKALTDIAKTVRMGTGGVPLKNGAEGMSPLSGGEMFMQGLGFNPARKANYDEARSAAFRETRKDNDLRKHLTNGWVSAASSDKHEAFKAIQRYNAGKPKEEQITMQQLTSAGKRKDDVETMAGTVVNKRNRRMLEETEHTYNVR